MSDTCSTITEHNKPHHVTCVVHELLPVFSQPEVVRIVFDCWRHLRERCGMRLYGYVIMEEHLHFLAQAERLDICLGGFREQTAGRIVKYLEEQRLERFLKRFPTVEGGRKYCFWQEPWETESISGSAMMCKTLDYIHVNPIKRGYVDRAEQWRYSSARNYAGESGVFGIDRWEDEADV
ncbi:MAG: transposase [Desulfuromonadales bacterium]|nr:transposase [Desulfuromonadales bacterium]